MGVVTLTTDFGVRDPYVAEMKGVMLGLHPHLLFVDITHEVESHDVGGAALILDAASRFFPPGTVHLAVVDPGVGSARRGLVVTADDAVFVAPDNGLLTPILARGAWKAFEVSAPDLRLPRVSRTFHGRDVFAPAAAHLAAGVAPERFGGIVDDPVRLPWPDVHTVGGAVSGAVVHVDRFGNLITSITAEALDRLGAEASIHIAGRRLSLVGTYADLPRGGVGALVGSSDRLEVAVREGSAAAVLRARRGTPVAVSPKTAPTTTGRKPTTKSRRPLS